MDCLIQYKQGKSIKLGLLRDGFVYDISEKWSSMLDFLDYVVKSKINIPRILGNLNLKNEEKISYEEVYPYLLPPIFSSKIYGLGITYKISEVMRIKNSKDSAHDNAVKSGRLVTFYKGDFNNCMGTNSFLNLRGDSNLTTPEPELAAIISNKGEILGYTIFNDVTAYDLELTSSLFTPEAKEYIGSCSVGPFFSPKENFEEVPKLNVKIQILRGKKIIFEKISRTDLIRDKPQKLINELCKYRYIPNGTLVTLGSSIIVPDEFALKQDDEVVIEIENLGILRNKFKQLK